MPTFNSASAAVLFSNQKFSLLYGRYVFGITHVPRLEDWPVMPVDRIGFTLLVLTLILL